MTTEPVTGAIPRIERQESHYNFLWATRPPTVMVDLIHAARIAMHNDTFFPPETDVILTSTISDQKLATYSFEDELRITRALNPEYVIPFDFPVYTDMHPNKRLEHIQQIATGTRDMNHILGPLDADEIDRVATVKNLPHELVEPAQDTQVIPLVKGSTRQERQILLDAATDINAPTIAKYGVQYMTIGSNGSYPELCNSLARIHNQSNGHPLLIIGLLSPSGQYSLEGLPDSVVAAAGTNQWVKRINPSTTNPTAMPDIFEPFYNAVSNTLDVQTTYTPPTTSDLTPPETLEKTPGNAVSDDLSPGLAGASKEGGYGFGERKRDTSATGPVTAGRKGGNASHDTTD